MIWGFVAIFTLLVFAIRHYLCSIHSREVLVVNNETQRVMYEKNTCKSSVPIASLTKLMTYAVVCDIFDDFSAQIVVDGRIVEELKQHGASMAGLKVGYSYTVKNLLYGLMLPSGCDAAKVLASHIGEEEFVQKMNEKAIELGMYDTHFADSSGLGTDNENNVSTTKDIYLLFSYLIIHCPFFVDIISTPTCIIGGVGKDGTKEKHEIKNTNCLIDRNSQYFNPNVVGGKTGTLNAAGRCLVAFAQKGDRHIIVVTLGVPGDISTYYNFSDANKLIKRFIG